MMRCCWFCGEQKPMNEIATVGGVRVRVCSDCGADLDLSAAADREAMRAHLDAEVAARRAEAEGMDR